ncbi:uncharacterized protein LOC131231198 [Magnolia sinica]|uniref:uncharacterized protein LOC131231198 n=1 Tax=Magnolia sinica TaxID=86752 RepID=UPI00265840A2|nr:uncharacterized protein LOC131231198 [Magnolia sinica]XP_058083296.1 uncharacterized protein LOC131231198 [Magnolia sinica]
MGAEKQSSKGRGGFFHLFDWNGKSRKKLFSNEFNLPEGTKQGKRSEENLPMTRLRLIEEDEIGRVVSAKGSSDFSCASSSTDDEGTGIKPLGVVARLMGLDSLPVSCTTEPGSTPFFEPRSLQDAHYDRKTPDLPGEYQNASSKNQTSRVNGFSRKESRPQKLPSSPIERFQTETLPLKSGKSYPVTHHKLLSPIKNPGFMSAKNATDIMEAAAKIIEPGLQASAKGKLPSVGSASVPIKIRDLKENVRASQRTSRLPEVPRRPIESNAIKHLKGQSLNKSWNGPEDTPSFKVSPDMEESHSNGARKKGKSVSLAIQAKVNVQRREGMNSSSRSSLVLKEDDRQKSIQPFKSNQDTVKNNKKKYPTGQKNSSGVLRQNNQKQNNTINKNKLPSKPSVSNQQGRKFMTGDASSGRSISFNKVSANRRDGNKKEASAITDLEKDAPASQTKNFPRKKRAIGDGEFVDTVSVDRDEKELVQPDVAISEHLDWAEDNGGNGMDVVSFTFTSPMIKPPVSGSWSNGQMVEKPDRPNTCHVDSTDGNKNKRVSSSLGLNVIGGDALSILLEQKLRELTSGIESSYSNSVKTSTGTASSSILQDVVSSLNALSILPEERDSQRGPKKDKLGGGSSSGCSSTNGQVFKMNHKLQGLDGIMEYSSGIETQKELDYQHTSPLSILEASFSNESCNSSESLDGSNGSKTHSSIQSQETVGSNSSMKTSSEEAELELSDSASSAFMGAIDQEHMRTAEQEMEYVKEILCSAELMFKDLPLGHTHGIINSHLFDRLENQKAGSRSEGEDEGGRLRQKELFDCVSECVDLKFSRYIRRGYKAWLKGAIVVRMEDLSEEIYKEVLGWRNMREQMADELIEKDMSSHSGMWLDFETEAFEVGVEIERRILSSLVAEVVADMLV